jgi:serine/threonine protein kinase
MRHSSSIVIPPVYTLLGRELKDGWKIVERFNWNVDASGVPAGDWYGLGGHFSIGYVVERGGRRAFMKAINLEKINQSTDVLTAMKELSDTVEFEKAIQIECTKYKMDRIVKAIDTGEIKLGPNIQDRVPYLILELADGDVRRRLETVDSKFALPWKLRALHHVATGLMQVHARDIAHQDLKPSNVMSFEEEAVFKIGDFGRSSKRGLEPPHEGCGVAGALAYAPPELLYGHFDSDWRRRRVGCDLYLLGSMVMFFFTGHGTTVLLMNKLLSQHKPISFNGRWNGTFLDALPYISSAFGDVIQDLRLEVPNELVDEVLPIVMQLCEPNPLLRGHPKARAQHFGNPQDLSRYVSKFDLLAKRAEILAQRTLK